MAENKNRYAWLPVVNLAASILLWLLAVGVAADYPTSAAEAESHRSTAAAMAIMGAIFWLGFSLRAGK